jgi:hypothetical protein
LAEVVMPSTEPRKDEEIAIERDYDSYKLLLGLWAGENPIKTNKLQVLLAVNGLLVTAVSFSGGFKRDLWYVYVAGTAFSLIWTLSIGRTALFQDVWQMNIQELQTRYPNDSRFALLDSSQEREKADWVLRVLGGIPSRWYLLFSPFVLALAWLAILIYAR